MATRFFILMLFGVIALALGQVKGEETTEQPALLSQRPKPTDIMRETLSDEELADWLANLNYLERQEEAPKGRVRRQVGGQSVLNTGPGHDYSRLGSLSDRNGGRHSLLGHFDRQGPSYGLGYQYGTPNGRSQFGAGVSNQGYRLGASHSWTSGRNGRFQHSLGGSYGHNRRTGHSAGLTYRLRFRRAAQQQGGGSVLNTGPGHDYSRLGSISDRNGGRHSLLGHFDRQGPSYGLGYQYGTPNGRSQFGAGLSNQGYRLGASHSWTSGRNGRFQHSLGGSYGHNRRTGHSAGLTYRLRFRRDAQQTS